MVKKTTRKESRQPSVKTTERIEKIQKLDQRMKKILTTCKDMSENMNNNTDRIYNIHTIFTQIKNKMQIMQTTIQKMVVCIEELGIVGNVCEELIIKLSRENRQSEETMKICRDNFEDIYNECSTITGILSQKK